MFVKCPARYIRGATQNDDTIAPTTAPSINPAMMAMPYSYVCPLTETYSPPSADVANIDSPTTQNGNARPPTNHSSPVRVCRARQAAKPNTNKFSPATIAQSSVVTVEF